MPCKLDYDETDISGRNLYSLCDFCNRKFVKKFYLVRHLNVCGSSFVTGDCKESFSRKPKQLNKNRLYTQSKIRQPDIFNIQRDNINTPDNPNTGSQNFSAEHKHLIAEAEKFNTEPEIPQAEPKDPTEEPKPLDAESDNLIATPENLDKNCETDITERQSCSADHQSHSAESWNLRTEPLNLGEVQSVDSESENHSKEYENTAKPSKKRRCKKSFTCRECNLVCGNKSKLFLHKAKKHGQSLAKLEQFGKKCVCQKAYNSTAQLRFHIRRDHFNLQATLPYCEQKKVNQVWFEKVMNCNNIMEIRKTAPNTLVMRKLNEKTAIKVVEGNRKVIDLTDLYPTGRINKFT